MLDIALWQYDCVKKRCFYGAQNSVAQNKLLSVCLSVYCVLKKALYGTFLCLASSSIFQSYLKIKNTNWTAISLHQYLYSS